MMIWNRLYEGLKVNYAPVRVLFERIPLAGNIPAANQLLGRLHLSNDLLCWYLQSIRLSFSMVMVKIHRIGNAAATA